MIHSNIAVHIFKPTLRQRKSKCVYIVYFVLTGLGGIVATLPQLALATTDSTAYVDMSNVDINDVDVNDEDRFYEHTEYGYADEADDYEDIADDADAFESELDDFNDNDIGADGLEASPVIDNQNGAQDILNSQQIGANLNIFERRKLQSTLDDNLVVKDVPLNAVSPETLKTFVQVIDLVRRDYVEPVSDEVLFNDAIAGMLEKLDSHAEFLDAEAYDNLRAFTEGDVGHVGLEVQFLPLESQWVITNVAPNSPAQLNGLNTGDYLQKINDIKLNAGMHETDVSQLLSGIAGTQVEVEVSSAGREKRTVTLQRNIPKKQQLEVEVIDNVAYIKLPVFQNDTAIQIIEAFELLDTPITGVLIDLQNNPGGVLTSAVEVAGLFMDHTDVVQIRGRRTPLKVLSTQGIPLLQDLPVVILQNRYSASASEVLASSLQINQRAIIVGERSYGKGSIQAILPLDEEKAIKMTVAHYFGADGSKIDGEGVTPDIVLPKDGITPWKQQALSILLAQKRPLGMIFSTFKDGIAIEEDY